MADKEKARSFISTGLVVRISVYTVFVLNTARSWYGNAILLLAYGIILCFLNCTPIAPAG